MSESDKEIAKEMKELENMTGDGIKKDDKQKSSAPLSEKEEKTEKLPITPPKKNVKEGPKDDDKNDNTEEPTPTEAEKERELKKAEEKKEEEEKKKATPDKIDDRTGEDSNKKPEDKDKDGSKKDEKETESLLPPELRGMGLTNVTISEEEVPPKKLSEEEEQKKKRDKYDEPGRDTTRTSKAPEKTEMEKQVGLA